MFGGFVAGPGAAVEGAVGEEAALCGDERGEGEEGEEEVFGEEGGGREGRRWHGSEEERS